MDSAANLPPKLLSLIEQRDPLSHADRASLLDHARRLVEVDDEAFWKSDVAFHHAIARALVAAGYAAVAHNYADKAIAIGGGDDLLRFQRALALARGGNLARASVAVNDLLARLRRAGNRDKFVLTETLSLGGRLSKDMARREKSRARQRKHFKAAADMYERAWRVSGDYFPGINAATMKLLCEPSDRSARRIAQRVFDLAAKSRDTHYWRTATLGEACLILGRPGDAEQYYGDAAAAAGDRIGDVASMRRNVELIARKVDVPRAVREALRIGSIVVFSGHMIDQPDRSSPRFPDDRALERRVIRAIGERIDNLDASIGYTSAACGGDIIFAEQMLKRGREVHLVLPFDMDDFRRTSVDFGDKSMARWGRRFNKLIKLARVHYATAEPYLGDDVLFDFANHFAQGLATVRAAELGLQPSAMFLVDQSSRSRTGGSMQMLQRWRKGGRAMEVVDLALLRDGLKFEKRSKKRSSKTVAPKRGANRRRIRYMLFSDVKNFSKLKEQQNPAFYAQFMRLAARVMDRCGEPPMYANTWGDALYMVFERAAPCADYAMRLIEQVEKTDWTVFDLPADTTLRVGMHGGPVYQHYNRVTHRPDVLGTHVNRAARIEPVTTPGCAFVSEHFAAALAVESPDAFACEYVGVVDLAKKFGRSGLYHLTRRSH